MTAPVSSLRGDQARGSTGCSAAQNVCKRKWAGLHRPIFFSHIIDGIEAAYWPDCRAAGSRSTFTRTARTTMRWLYVLSAAL